MTTPPDMSDVFALWPPPRVADIDPRDFGIVASRTKPIEGVLNPYVPRDVDNAIVTALGSARSVVVSAREGAGAVRTVYEALNRVLPDAPLLLPRLPGEFDPEKLSGMGMLGPAVLWIDHLGLHWRGGGASLVQALQRWLHGSTGWGATGWLVAVCYDGSSSLLSTAEFRALNVPVVRMEAELSDTELAAMQGVYGQVTTRTHIGYNPPLPGRRDLLAFSKSVQRIVSELGVDTAATASVIAEALRERRGHYARDRFRSMRLKPDAGSRRTVGAWLAAVRDCYDHADLVASTHDRIDGRLTLYALAVLDPDLSRALGDEFLAALAAECSVVPVPVPVPPPVRREHVRWLADEPVGLDDDKLGRVGVARALEKQLLELIENYPGRSFLVHIDGAWGTGKSTLLRFLRESVETHQRWLVVQYDAWRQCRAGPPWLTMLHAVRTAVRAKQRGPFRQIGFWLKERARLLRLWHWVAGALLLAGVVVVVAALTLLGGPAPELWVRVVTILGTVATVGTAWEVIAARFALDSRRAARTFTETRADPMEDLARHFAWILRRADRPVLLLIDDVDRCAEGFVVELLDAVQKLMRDRDTGSGDESAPNLLVVVAADGRWIRQSYDAAYASLAPAVRDPGVTIGSVFLEKLFQLTVPVPQLSGDLKTQFLRSLLVTASPQRDIRSQSPLFRRLHEVPRDEVLNVLADASLIERVHAAEIAIDRLVIEQGSEQETTHALEPYASLLDPTPRAMKRFVMAYSMLRAVRTAEGSVVGLGPLALWTILRIRWPLLAEYMHDHPNAVKLFCLPEDRLPASVPAEIVGLFVDPPDDLKAVMNHPDGPLTTHAIRECSGQPEPARSLL